MFCSLVSESNITRIFSGIFCCWWGRREGREIQPLGQMKGWSHQRIGGGGNADEMELGPGNLPTEMQLFWLEMMRNVYWLKYCEGLMGKVWGRMGTKKFVLILGIYNYWNREFYGLEFKIFTIIIWVSIQSQTPNGVILVKMGIVERSRVIGQKKPAC